VLHAVSMSAPLISAARATARGRRRDVLDIFQTPLNESDSRATA
jgi:hypothetical protein